jgi:hypothetical protein
VCLGVGQLSNVEWVKTVNIFVLGDALNDGLLVQMAWKRELHQDAVDIGV